MKATATRNQKDTTVAGTLYLAFELSRKSWKLAFTTGLGQKPRQRTVPAPELGVLREELVKARERFGLPADAPVVSCYEAGRDGFWLHRALVKMGVHNLVVDSASIEVKRRARHAKADALDAHKLLTMLIRYHLGEHKVWSVVNVPSAQAEDVRHLHRELQELKRERTRQINRVKALLEAQGLRLDGRCHIKVDLEKVRLWNGKPLPPYLKERIQRLYERVAFLNEQIEQVRVQQAELLMTSTAPEIKQVRQLMLLKGIGPHSSWLYALEFFSWRKFRNRREVGALAGLAPTPYQSGETSRDRGISKAGNRYIRAVAIQNAWAWLRFQPDSALSRWYEERFGGGGSRLRRIGIVALARKLLIVLWRYVEFGEIPEGAVVLR